MTKPVDRNENICVYQMPGHWEIGICQKGANDSSILERPRLGQAAECLRQGPGQKVYAINPKPNSNMPQVASFDPNAVPSQAVVIYQGEGQREWCFHPTRLNMAKETILQGNKKPSTLSKSDVSYIGSTGLRVDAEIKGMTTRGLCQGQEVTLEVSVSDLAQVYVYNLTDDNQILGFSEVIMVASPARPMRQSVIPVGVKNQRIERLVIVAVPYALSHKSPLSVMEQAPQLDCVHRQGSELFVEHFGPEAAITTLTYALREDGRKGCPDNKKQIKAVQQMIRHIPICSE